MSGEAPWSFQSSTGKMYSLIVVPQCLGGLLQTNQSRNTTSLIHNVIIHFTCLLRHPRPVIYMQRWSQGNPSNTSNCIHTFINWSKYSVTSQWGMDFPLPPVCILYGFHYHLINVLWHTIYLSLWLWGVLCGSPPHLYHPLGISQINHISRLRQCSTVLKRKKRLITRFAGRGLATFFSLPPRSS